MMKQVTLYYTLDHELEPVVLFSFLIKLQTNSNCSSHLKLYFVLFFQDFQMLLHSRVILFLFLKCIKQLMWSVLWIGVGNCLL